MQLVESLSSTYKTKLESGEGFEDNKKEKHLLIKYSDEELLGQKLKLFFDKICN